MERKIERLMRMVGDYERFHKLSEISDVSGHQKDELRPEELDLVAAARGEVPEWKNGHNSNQ